MTHEEWVKRFWARVHKRAAHQCWSWVGSRDVEGYGHLKRTDGSGATAHRVAAELKHGQRIPSHLVVMHTCDNPSCVNPMHLRVGTQRENVLDMHAKGRQSQVVLRGDEHGSTKISDEDVQRMRAMWQEKKRLHLTQEKLAREFGITQAQVSRILNGKRRQ